MYCSPKKVLKWPLPLTRQSNNCTDNHRSESCKAIEAGKQSRTDVHAKHPKTPITDRDAWKTPNKRWTETHDHPPTLLKTLFTPPDSHDSTTPPGSHPLPSSHIPYPSWTPPGTTPILGSHRPNNPTSTGARSLVADRPGLGASPPAGSARARSRIVDFGDGPSVGVPSEEATKPREGGGGTDVGPKKAKKNASRYGAHRMRHHLSVHDMVFRVWTLKF